MTFRAITHRVGGMELRVDDLAERVGVTVDTIRYYQSRGLIPPPRREGRIVFYGREHITALQRVRTLQFRGFTLAVIRRILDGDLDAADEALVVAVAAPEEGPDGPEAFLTLEEVAQRSGIPLALLQAVEREGLLVARQTADGPRFTEADVAAATAGLSLLEQGLPLPEILALARRHHEAMRAVAEEAVRLFDTHVRQPLRSAGLTDEEAAIRLVDAFNSLLPATTDLITHHFRRVLLAVAQEHIDHVGDDAERQAVADQAARRLEVVR